MKKLAIIIPAYKSNFLENALESIAKQSCIDFTVYVGDDASPQDLKKIVEKYAGILEIYYTRFEQNMGGLNLVGQWERCIALSKNEEWIWLFSDDDEMTENCVASFFEHIKSEPNKNFFHFDVDVIDENENILKSSCFPKRNISDIEFIEKKLRGKINSYVVEYIFSRKLYEKVGGFEKFDLAWNSDDATWVKMAAANGIETISDAKIRWRKSSLNISPNDKNSVIVRKKVAANLEYMSFLRNHFEGKCSKKELYIPIVTWFIVCLIKYKGVLSSVELKRARMDCLNILGMQKYSILVWLYMVVKRALLK